MFLPSQVRCRSCWRVRINSAASSADLSSSYHQRCGQDCLAMRVNPGMADGSCERGGRRVLALMTRLFFFNASLSGPQRFCFFDDFWCSLRACAHLRINLQRIACLHSPCRTAVSHSFAYSIRMLISRGIPRCLVPLWFFAQAVLSASLRRAHLPPPRRAPCPSDLLSSAKR